MFNQHPGGDSAERAGRAPRKESGVYSVRTGPPTRLACGKAQAMTREPTLAWGVSKVPPLFTPMRLQPLCQPIPYTAAYAVSDVEAGGQRARLN